MFKFFLMPFFAVFLLMAAPESYAQSAIENLRASAERGDDEAQFELGFLYAEGLSGAPKSYEKAAEWWRKSAEQGNSGAQFGLGSLYAEGLGVPRNHTKAVELFHKAAAQGHLMAQMRLGYIYFHGSGVSRDFEEAFFWLSLVPSTNPDIAGYRNKAREKLTPSQLAGIETRLREFNMSLRQSVQQKTPQMMRDIRLEAENGAAWAQFELGLLYLRGVEFPADFAAARQLIQAAASQGYEEAQKLLQDGLLETIWAEENNKRQEQTEFEKEMLLWVDALITDILSLNADNFVEKLRSNTKHFTPQAWTAFAEMVQEIRLDRIRNTEFWVSAELLHFPEIVNRGDSQDGGVFITEAIYGIKLSSVEREKIVRRLRLRISVETDAARQGAGKGFTIVDWSYAPPRPFMHTR